MAQQDDRDDRDDSIDNEQLSNINRRRVLAGTGAALGAGVVGTAGFLGPTMAQESPRRIEIQGAGPIAEYTIVVSGELSRTDGLNATDTISDDSTTATGQVGGGTDPYLFTGTVKTIEISGPAKIVIDGDGGDGSNGGTGNGTTTHRLDIVGDGTRSDYSVIVSGTIQYVDGSQNYGDMVIDDETTASGHVGGGTDSMEFTGDILSFSFQGSGEVVLDGEVVDPTTIGSDAGSGSGGDGDGDGSGSGTIDNLSDGFVMFIFDDGKESHPRASRILDDYGFDGVFAIITSRVSANSNPSIADFKQMQGNGHEIESHTVTHANDYPTKKLTGASDSEVRFECRESREWLEDNGFWTRGGSVIVYPRGGANSDVADIARQYYTFGFEGGNFTEPIFGWDDPLRIYRTPGQNLSETKSLIREAGQNGGVVPIMLHSVVDDANQTSRSNDITPSQLRDLCQTMQENGVSSILPREFRDAVRSQ
jgi:peptidoglycan/xylan/chitin deacetylase (PgdA/CDA1 family)/carbon monoxide dehydrogenase subunit G